MKVIALLPVKNEAWIIEHTLASLSGFCDVILVNDQQSIDGTREIAARFPKAVWIESAESHICEQARWRLWDVARDYDGTNLVWCTDADELVSPKLARRFIDEHRAELTGGAVVDSLYCHFWNSPDRYRTGLGGASAPISSRSRSWTIGARTTTGRGRCPFTRSGCRSPRARAG